MPRRILHSFQITGKEPKKNHDFATIRAAAEFLAGTYDQPILLVVSFINQHNACDLARGQNLSDGTIGPAPSPDKCPPAPANLAPQQDEPDTITIMRRGYWLTT